MILKPCPVCASKRLEPVLERGIDYEYGIRGDFNVKRCQDCGLLHLNPRPDLPEIVSFYPPTYHAYQKPSRFVLFRLLNGLRWVIRARQVRKLIGARGRILDVGCGDGELMERLGAREDWDLWGVDFNKDGIEEARKKGLNAHLGVLEDVDLPKRSFDLIVMNHLVEHLEEPVRTPRRAGELLAENGRIVGQLPNTDSWERGLFGPFWAGYHFPRHLQFFSPATLARTFREAGFSKVTITAALHPGQWPISFENRLISARPDMARVNGKIAWYGIFLFLCAPLTLAEYLCGKASMMDFTAER